MRSVISFLLVSFSATIAADGQSRTNNAEPAWVNVLGYVATELHRIKIGDFGYPFVEVSIDGTAFELPFDTGNMVGLSLTRPSLNRLTLPTIGGWSSRDSDGRVLGHYAMYQARRVVAFGRDIRGDTVYELADSALPGLIGPRHLAARRFTLDYQSGLMAVSDRTLPELSGNVLPLVRSREHPLLLLVRGRVNGHDALFEIDTGKSRSTIDARFARELNLAIDDKGARGVTLELGGQAYSVRAARLEDLRGIDRSLREPILVGVGSDMLSQFVWTVDYQSGSLALGVRSVRTQLESSVDAGGHRLIVAFQDAYPLAFILDSRQLTLDPRNASRQRHGPRSHPRTIARCAGHYREKNRERGYGSGRFPATRPGVMGRYQCPEISSVKMPSASERSRAGPYRRVAPLA